MILIGSGHSRLDAGVIFSETEAPARARASFPKCVFEGRATTTTAPARYFLKIYSETPWPERPPNTGTALSLETSSQFTQVGGGPATTTTAPARYFLAIYSETPWPERPPNSGTALSLESSSRIIQVGVCPASALSRLTAMAAWCAYRVPNASPRSWYEKKPPKRGLVH